MENKRANKKNDQELRPKDICAARRGIRRNDPTVRAAQARAFGTIVFDLICCAYMPHARIDVARGRGLIA